MDVARPDLARTAHRRRILTWTGVAALLVAASVAATRLGVAAPAVDKDTLVTDIVKRGLLTTQVRGSGTLVPERILYVPAETEGRVERILVAPGTAVRAGEVIVELNNAQLKRDAFDAEWQLKVDVAQLTSIKGRLDGERLVQVSAIASLQSECEQSRLEDDAHEQLAKQGLVSTLTARQAHARAADLAARLASERERLETAEQSRVAQLAAQKAVIERVRAQVEAKKAALAALNVQAGIDGVLQQLGDALPLQVGQRVTPTTTLAKIVQPWQLKAAVRIAETQARDVVPGQSAEVDTHSLGIMRGRVSRVDPSVQNGTVTVDIILEGALPKGARPDQTVDGTIELERLDDVLHVGRPAQAQAQSTVALFKLVDNGRAAVRVAVKVGRASIGEVEVRDGLQRGDEVVVSDMSQWESYDRVRVK
jgi:HlyD family secretion protein